MEGKPTADFFSWSCSSKILTPGSHFWEISIMSSEMFSELPARLFPHVSSRPSVQGNSISLLIRNAMFGFIFLDDSIFRVRKSLEDQTPMKRPLLHVFSSSLLWVFTYDCLECHCILESCETTASEQNTALSSAGISFLFTVCTDQGSIINTRPDIYF